MLSSCSNDGRLAADRWAAEVLHRGIMNINTIGEKFAGNNIFSVIEVDGSCQCDLHIVYEETWDLLWFDLQRNPPVGRSIDRSRSVYLSVGGDEWSSGRLLESLLAIWEFIALSFFYASHCQWKQSIYGREHGSNLPQLILLGTQVVRWK